VNGELKSILDNENQLINADLIDSVSDDISSDFRKLINIEFED
jgi:hypothetical protein